MNGKRKEEIDTTPIWREVNRTQGQYTTLIDCLKI